MKEFTWKKVGIIMIMFFIIWVFNSYTPQFMLRHDCVTNDDCLMRPSMHGCIKVEGLCNATLCQVPACLNGHNVEWVRHGGST